MRTILHHPDFQALEAAWRSVWMLLQGVGPEDGIEIYLCDASLADLNGDAAAIVRLIAGAKKPWGLLVANFSFGERRQGRRSFAGPGPRRAGGRRAAPRRIAAAFG